MKVSHSILASRGLGLLQSQASLGELSTIQEVCSGDRASLWQVDICLLRGLSVSFQYQCHELWCRRFEDQCYRYVISNRYSSAFSECWTVV